MIIAFLVIFLSIAANPAVQPIVNEMNEIINLVSTVQLVITTCGKNIVQSQDLSRIPACKDFIHGVNNALGGYLNNTRENITKLLLD